MTVDATSDNATENVPARDTGFQIAIEVGDGWKRRLAVAVSPEKASVVRGQQRNRLSKTLKLKGFRKGKVPGSVVETRFGPLLDEQTLNALVESAFREAVNEHDLRPVGGASVSKIQYEPDRQVTFELELEVMPELELTRIGGFKLQRELQETTQAEEDEILERIRDEQAKWEPSTGKPAPEDRVSVEITRVEETGQAEELRPYTFVLGSGQAVEEVEHAIESLAAGAEDTFDLEFPGESEDAAPEMRRMHIRLTAVETKILPELDDDLAARAGDFETLEDLRSTIRQDLARHHEEEAERQLRHQLLEAVIDSNPFEPPQVMIDRYVQSMIQAPEDADPEELRQARESIAPYAKRQIQDELVIDHLIRREALEATPDEIEARLSELAARSGDSATDVRRALAKRGELDALGRHLAVEKMFAYLKSQSGLA
jgi:trigger factor